MNRKQILDLAEQCVCVDRDEQYGDAEDNFALIASFWNVYKGEAIFDAEDVAIMMALLKIARIKTGNSADSYVDLAGYAACAGEIRGKCRNE